MNIENDEGANLSSFCFMVRSCYAYASIALPAAGAAEAVGHYFASLPLLMIHTFEA